MGLSRKSTIKGNGKKLETFLPQDEKDYLNEFGIRMVYNEKGEPSLISYGRWSYVENSNNDYINKMSARSAAEQAKSRADAMLADFINTSLSFNSQAESGEIVEDILTKEIDNKNGGESITSNEVTNIIDKVSSQTKAKSRMQLKGISTLEEWDFVDENNIGHVGVVRVWTYANVEARENSLKLKSQTNQKATNSNISSSRTSKQVNSLDDF